MHNTLRFSRLVANYWHRPAFRPEIWRKVIRYTTRVHFIPSVRAKYRRRLAEEGARAREWCAERAILTEELAQQLPIPFVLIDVRRKFPDEFSEGIKHEADCPYDPDGGGNSEMLYSLARSIRALSIVEKIGSASCRERV